MSSAQFPWLKIFKESSVAKLIDVSFFLLKYCYQSNYDSGENIFDYIKIISFFRTHFFLLKIVFLWKKVLMAAIDLGYILLLLVFVCLF